jgi:glucose-1-phosphate adenylyltransferase
MGADYYETIEEIKENALKNVPNIGVGNHVTITNAIIDKNVRIGDNVMIVNSRNMDNYDGENFFVRDNIVVVPKGAIIPSGTTI